MPAGVLMPVGQQVFFNAAGAVLNGGSVTTYAAGTTTPLATYSDSNLSIPNANPVVLNSAGRATIFINAALAYKIVVKDALGNTIYTQDNVALNLTALSGGAQFFTAVTIVITAGVNNLARGNANVIYLDGGAGTLDGIEGGAAGLVVFLVNRTGAALLVAEEVLTVPAIDRFKAHGGSYFIDEAGVGVAAYSATDSRWYALQR